MKRPWPLRDDYHLRFVNESGQRLTIALVAVGVALSALTVGVVLNRHGSVVVADDRLDLIINSAATLIATGIAGLTWIQFREDHRIARLYQSSAFLVLTALNAVFVAVVALRVEGKLGMTLGDPHQGALYIWTVARLVAAGLLLLGGLSMIREWRPRSVPPVIAVVPTAIVLALFMVALRMQDVLPPLVSTRAVEELTPNGDLPSDLAAVTAPGLVIQSAVAAVFVIAALVYRRVYIRDGDVTHAYLSVGLIVAAFSQLHYALYPGALASLVTTGDVLRVGFYAILLVGAEVAGWAGIRAL
ncbi:MAG: hypothetical protein ABR509_00475, partial [Candidatus Limnocylindria bacterium]